MVVAHRTLSKVVDAVIPNISTDGSTLLHYALGDVISCEVTKAESGEYTLRMDYPVDGVFAEQLTLRNRINAIASRASAVTQPFLISKIEQNISGVISVTANHLTYDLNRYPVRAFEKASRTPEEAISALYANSLRDPSSDFLYVRAEASTTKQEFGFKRPTTWRDALYGSGGLLDVYGGFLIADDNSVKWYSESSVGSQKGTIRYGVNLTKFKRTYDVSDTYSHAYVYWKDGDTLVQCSGLVQLGNDSDFLGATVLDLSTDFETTPTTSQLEQKAKDVAWQRGLTNAEVSLDISFVPLRLTDEYKDMTWLEEIDLFDKVAVEVPMYGSRTYARVTKTKFDVLAENYTRVTVGNLGRSLDKTIARLI